MFVWCASLLALLMSVACGSHRTPSGTTEIDPAAATHDTTMDQALARSQLVEDARGGLIATTWHDATTTQGVSFGARVPANARGAIDVGLATTDDVTSGAHADFALRVTHDGLADAPLANDAGHALYRDVATSTDLLVSAGDTQAEWFYRLRDAHAPTTFAMHVALGRGLTMVVTKHDGSLAFQDARGKTRLAIPTAYAVDARGVKRDVTLAWKGDARGPNGLTGRLEVKLDARGLAYPVLIDPSVALPLWEEVNAGGSGPISVRFNASMAYDSARGKTVLFGGEGIYGDFNETWEWDGTTWTQRSSTNVPSARDRATMVYDSARATTVLFGGYSATDESSLNDTWEWDGTNWTERTTASAPSPRYGATMAYDSIRGKTVLFGGGPNYYSPSLNDTWEWDGATWTQRTSTNTPPGQNQAAMAYDSGRGKTVLFVSGTGNTTWEWDGTNWTQRTTASAPASRTGATMAYDSGRAKTVLFGGSGNSYFNDTWEWDGTSWTQRTPTSAPIGRYQAAMAYDSARAKTVLFGGDGFDFLNDTWEWDGTTWTQRATNTSVPSGRSDAAMTYDSARTKTVLFGGGVTTGSLGDTWEFDGTNWTQRTPTSAPSSRYGAAMAYDSTRSKSILFGGFSSGAGNDTWEWDGTNWTQRTSTSVPPGRHDGALAYDSGRGKSVLFGGQGSGVTLSDTWEWDGTNWTQRAPTNVPSSRYAAAMAYDSGRAKTVLFGGENIYGTHYNDTWEWNGTNWTLRTSTNSPSGRQYVAMAYDSTRGKSVLFGGSGNAAYLGDTWEWDGTNWTSPSLPSPVGRQGASMAFDTQHGIVLFGGESVTAQLNDTWLYVTVAGACTTTATCDSGYCVDGVCCAQSACGACQSCAITGSEGQCTNVAAGTVPTTGDPNACAAPNVCTASAVCAFPKGAACANGGECLSGFCTDGVCCDSACTGDCQACGTSRGLAENGTCAFAPEGTAGRATCASDFVCNGKGSACPTTCTDDASCAAGYYCNAAGACVAQKQQGASCSTTAGADCLTSDCHECAPVGDASTGQCVDNVCCDTPCDGACATCNASGAVGTCTNALAHSPGGVDGRTLCAPYTCTGEASTCGTNCATDADCADQAYCDVASHTCKGTATLGTPCSAGDACASTNCVGGVCCSSTCGAASSDGGASVCDVGICNAATGFACQLPGATLQCRPQSCADAKLSLAASCNSNGACGAVEQIGCPAGLACNVAATDCNTTCAKDADCQTANNFHCDTASGNCVQGASCSADAKSVVSSNGAMTACAPYLCAGNKCGTSCASIADCQSGFVCSADGACMASASSGAVASPSSGGCGCRTAGNARSNALPAMLAMLVLGAGARRRRRRVRAGRLSREGLV